jgi:Na+/melibiose symporter-like transporter
MNNADVISGISTGIISAIIFNPLDKAIYVSTTKNISIFNRKAWHNMYSGVSYTICSKLITSGLYFYYIDYYLRQKNSNAEIALMTTLCCSITNPIQLVKFNSWYNDISIKTSTNNIIKNHGYKGFCIGISALLVRDFIFNYMYLSFKEKDNHFNNILTISGALIVVSPINVIKNKKYASNESMKSIIKNFTFNQLGISSSLLRFSVSFYFCQYLYDNTKKYLNNNYL